MISESIMKKIQNAPQKCRPNLLKIAKDPIFSENEKLFDLVLTQTSISSQNIVYRAIKEGASHDTIYHLIEYTDGPIKQERVIRYSRYDVIMKNEGIFLDMINMENEDLEKELFRLIQMKKIKDYETYNDKKIEINEECKKKKHRKKEDKILTEAEYQELKHKRILMDNVLKDTKKVLRTFGFLGIDIPRLEDVYYNDKDVAKSFDKTEYQKLFNVDDMGEERISINGRITNANSKCNYVELSVIFKELLNNYGLNNYKINIYKKDIYDLTTKYFKENVNLVSNSSEMIKFVSDNNIELANVSRMDDDITFNIKIDKLVDYIIEEKKENKVAEENLRDTIIYVDKEMEDNKKLYATLINNYLCEYHSIIVYHEDMPKDRLLAYCVSNNIKFVGFLEGNDDFRVLPIEKLGKPKTLGLNNNHRDNNDDDKNEGDK